MEREALVRLAWKELEPELADLGYELIEVEFGRHGATDILRLFIDREGGVTIDDCASVSRAVGALLDQRELIDSQYTLEVSSPGIDRPIRRVKDFELYIGEQVKIKAVTPVEGRKRFTGMLTGFQDGSAVVEVDGEPYSIHLENIKHANLDR